MPVRDRYSMESDKERKKKLLFLISFWSYQHKPLD
jgi:hypothetical protein